MNQSLATLGGATTTLSTVTPQSHAWLPIPSIGTGQLWIRLAPFHIASCAVWRVACSLSLCPALSLMTGSSGKAQQGFGLRQLLGRM